MERPKALEIVAWMFIAQGIGSAISIVASLLGRSTLALDFGVVGLWIGPGLLRGVPNARRGAFFLLGLGLVLAAIVFLLLLLLPGSVREVRIFGRAIGSVPAALGVLVSIGAFFVQLWQCWVLERPDVRARFEPDEGAPRRLMPLP